jgi:serine/threonine-protein kinase
MLVPEGDGHVPKIVDFGVCRSVAGHQSVLTRDYEIVGTPMYMAPEQVRAAHDVDRRSDLYSVGVVLYEALAGRPPFAAESLASLIVDITISTPPPLVEVRPDVGPMLSRIVARAMARDPGERFPDARAMRQALLAALAGRLAGA